MSPYKRYRFLKEQELTQLEQLKCYSLYVKQTNDARDGLCCRVNGRH